MFMKEGIDSHGLDIFENDITALMSSKLPFLGPCLGVGAQAMHSWGKHSSLSI